MKFSYFDVDQEQLSDWQGRVQANGYCYVTSGSVPGPVADGLKRKFSNALVVMSGSNDIMFVMVNGNRLDEGNTAIDQQPYGFMFSGSNPHGRGILVHHGDYHEDRTTYPPGLKDAVAASGSVCRNLFQQLPSANSGSFEELKVGSQLAAFELLVGELKKQLS